MGPALLALALVAYNSVANTWRAFHGWAYVPLNLVATVVVLFVGLGLFMLEPAEAGLRWAGSLPGILVAVAAAVVSSAMLAVPRTRALLRDRRLEGVRGWDAAFMVVVRIPIGTAVLEEVAFRGVLLGAMLSAGRTAAIVASSVAFGVWHVVPTLELARTNRLRARTLVVFGGVVGTGLAGAALAVVRVETGSIIGPLIAHASVNAFGAAASIAAWRLRR